MDLTIVTVNYNSSDHLEKLAASIEATRRSLEYELIIVDNHSWDRDPETLQRQFAPHRVILNPVNRGFAYACNQGMRLARGRAIALVNPDMVFKEDCLGKLLSYLDSHPETGAVGPQLLNADGSVAASCRRIPNVYHILAESSGLARLFPKSRLFGDYQMTYWAHDEERDVEQIMGACFVIKKAVVEDVGLFDENFFMYYEEVDWCKRILEKGYTIHFYPEAKAIHYKGESALTDKANALIQFYKSRNYFFLKHHGLAGFGAVKAISFLDTSLRSLFWGLKSLFDRSDPKARLFAKSYFQAHLTLWSGIPKAGTGR